MNDEFLYALRREPRREFASRLKRILQYQSEQRRARAPVRRALITAFLIGCGAAAAATVWFAAGKSPVQQLVRLPPTQPLATTQSPDQGDPSASERYRLHIVTSSVLHPLAKVIFSRLNIPPPADGWVTGYVAAVDALAEHVAFTGFCADEDVVISSRPLTADELYVCRSEGIRDVLQTKIGYQAVVLTRAPSGMRIKIDARDAYLALAKHIPDPANPRQLIENPNMTWNQVDPQLDSRRIVVFGPPGDSPIREVFEQLVLGAGCDTYPSLRALKDTDRLRYNDVCYTLREDGVYREIEQANTLITEQWVAEPDALLIVDYHLYQSHRTELAESVLEGVEPTMRAFAAGTYRASHPVYVYANKERLSRLLPEGPRFLSECCSDQAIGSFGYLVNYGLVPLEGEERRESLNGQSIPPKAADQSQDN